MLDCGDTSVHLGISGLSWGAKRDFSDQRNGGFLVSVGKGLPACHYRIEARWDSVFVVSENFLRIPTETAYK